MKPFLRPVLMVSSCNWTLLLLIFLIDDLFGKAPARASGALLSVSSSAPPPPRHVCSSPVFAESRKAAADWLENNECRSGATCANMSFVEKPKCA